MAYVTISKKKPLLLSYKPDLILLVMGTVKYYGGKGILLE